LDRLARLVASGSSRRGALVGLLAATLSGLGAGEETRARKKHKRCPCRPNCAGKVCGDDGCGKSCGACAAESPFCCNGACRGECCGDGQCAAGQVCRRGACVTPCQIDEDCPAAADTCCFGFCVNTDSDPANCGECGRPCNPPGTCVEGMCAVG
jgi:hypothetical protein